MYTLINNKLQTVPLLMQLLMNTGIIYDFDRFTHFAQNR